MIPFDDVTVAREALRGRRSRYEDWPPIAWPRRPGARLAEPRPAWRRAPTAGDRLAARGPGDLFVGLRGERADGGAFAAQALAAGAWGVLVAPESRRGGAGLAARLCCWRPRTRWPRSAGLAAGLARGAGGKA